MHLLSPPHSTPDSEVRREVNMRISFFCPLLLPLAPKVSPVNDRIEIFFKTEDLRLIKAMSYFHLTLCQTATSSMLCPPMVWEQNSKNSTWCSRHMWSKAAQVQQWHRRTRKSSPSPWKLQKPLRTGLQIPKGPGSWAHEDT